MMKLAKVKVALELGIVLTTIIGFTAVRSLRAEDQPVPNNGNQVDRSKFQPTKVVSHAEQGPNKHGLRTELRAPVARLHPKDPIRLALRFRGPKSRGVVTDDDCSVKTSPSPQARRHSTTEVG